MANCNRISPLNLPDLDLDIVRVLGGKTMSRRVTQSLPNHREPVVDESMINFQASGVIKRFDRRQTGVLPIGCALGRR